MTIRDVLLALPLLAIGWLCVLGVAGLFNNEAPAQIVMFPNSDFLGKLPSDVMMLDANFWSVTVASDQDGLAQKLYESGALLVLPAGLQGCDGVKSSSSRS